MRISLAAGLLIAPLLAGCAHGGPTSDERLDRETRGIEAPDQAIRRSDLAKINCQDANADLTKARSENRPEVERLTLYMALFESLKQRVDTFEEAMNRNPDLAYQEGNEPLVAAKDLCIEQKADVQREFETYVRDIVNVPIVKEVKGGATHEVARLDFTVLKRAIQDLAPDDKDMLLGKVAAAEKHLAAARKEPPEPISRRR
jgi:hypothetical protein